MKTEIRRLIEGTLPMHRPRGEGGHHRGEDQWSERFYHHCTEHNFGHKKRTSNRSIVSTRDSRRRSASHQMSSLRNGGVAKPPQQGRDQRRKLNERSLSPDRGTGADGEKGGNRFDQAGSEGNNTIPHHHRFHVVGGGFLPDSS